MLSRRSFLKLSGLAAVSVMGFSSYAFAIEPRFRLALTPYRLAPPGWPEGQRPIRIAAIADLHACDPWMPVSRIEEIVEATNRTAPDLIVLLGDFVAAINRQLLTGTVAIGDWARALGALEAPLGTFAVLGNHDWRDDGEAVRAGIEAAGIPVLENDATLLRPAGAGAFWLAGLGDQVGHYLGRGRFQRRDDLPGLLGKIDGEAPVVLLAHEPDIFPSVPDRVSLTLAGHTHGGQCRFPLIGSPVVPSRFGQRYVYGHIVEEGRHLIVSGGLGCSGLPVRFGVPPEIVLVELGAPPFA